MKMNLTKMTMLMTMMLTILSTTSTTSLLMMWMMMEVNLMSFLPLMTKSSQMKDQPMKFFIIQSLASSIMLMSILMNSMTESPVSSSIMLMSSLLMKMGLIPFHTWVPMIMNPMNWENCFMLMTIQKIIPTIIISQMLTMKLIMLPICLTMLVSPIMTIKQTSTKKIMAYSSITNSPWMVISMMNSSSQFFTFMSVYTLMTMMITKKMKENSIMFINQMMMKEMKKKVSIIINILSMSGMPPMMGFFPKWMILQSTISYSTTVSMSMIFSSIMSTFIYIKMMSPVLMITPMMKKIKLKKNELENDININLMGTILLMTMKSS
uniref:NADH dehydrogenase subunit 2 n=1 Tax=Pochazia confusa TaxID=1308480 RepID=UPI001EDFA852|nr:NADH dehydrogenase subunit 2 [Pochazia confusa]UJT96862.1 NADH dehydrogenase subunit 2 [Pochazia confusa]